MENTKGNILVPDTIAPKGSMENISVHIDPFSPTNYIYHRDKNDNILCCTYLKKIIEKEFPVFNDNIVYHFTRNSKEIIESGVFRFYWQMRNNDKIPDEVLSKFWFTEANLNLNGSLYWQTHGKLFNAFSLAQITRTACFFTGNLESCDADLMRKKFGNDIIKVNYYAFKNDVEKYCLKNNRKRISSI